MVGKMERAEDASGLTNTYATVHVALDRPELKKSDGMARRRCPRISSTRGVDDDGDKSD